jgi:hypothetical protein
MTGLGEVENSAAGKDNERLPYPFRVHGSPELRDATAALGRRLLAAGES